MTGCRKNRGLAANLLLALLLVAAQTSALAHAYEHEVGSSPNQACTACVTAGQLAAACVDNPAAITVSIFSAPLNQLDIAFKISINAIVVRQRGPPDTL
jgi:hypothetical protein